MKKVFILGFALLLFSCAQADTESLNSAESKEVSTVDPLIGYKSPYNDKGSTRLQKDMIEYLFNNETNFTFKIKPFFGLAFYDFENDNDGTGEFTYRGFESMADPTSLSYSPHLLANGKQYGNFMQSDYLNPITLVKTTKSFISAAPFYNPVPILNFFEPEGFDFSQGNPDGVATTFGELTNLSMFGKLYYAEVEVYKNGALIFETYLKADFPLVNSSSIYSNTGNWRTLYNDSFFGEKMVYNIRTGEICIPNTEESMYTSTEIFDYGAKTYKVGIASTTSKVEVYLKKVK